MNYKVVVISLFILNFFSFFILEASLKSPLLVMPTEDDLKARLESKGCKEFITSTSLVAQLSGKFLYFEGVLAIVNFSMNEYAVNRKDKHNSLATLWENLSNAKKTILEIILQDNPDALQKALEKVAV